jgi:hypothetical protein
MKALSPEFAELWDRHEVRNEVQGIKTVAHPAAGEIIFE